MSDSGESKYKWTPESTSLLVSIWTDKQVQRKLHYCTKPQVIWESVARYMQKKGYYVNGRQCRSRMKQVLVCYREAKRAGTREGVEQYYDSIDQVLKLKKLENFNNNNGVDTVGSLISFFIFLSLSSVYHFHLPHLNSSFSALRDRFYRRRKISSKRC